MPTIGLADILGKSNIMRWTMKENMKKPAILVMGSTLAFFSLASPMMASESKIEQIMTQETTIQGSSKTEVIKTEVNGNTDIDVKVKTSTDSKDQDTEVKSEAQVKSEIKVDGDTKEKLKFLKEDLIAEVSKNMISGEGKVNFTIKEGKDPVELEFVAYKKSGKDKIIHSKAKGKYSAGRYTLNLNLPDSDKYDVEISYLSEDNSRVLLWNREFVVRGAVSKPEPKVMGTVLVTGVSDASLSGKGKINFTVPEGDGPVELEFICYKKSDNGKIIYTKTKGTYSAGQHTIDLDLPKDSEGKYELEISNKTNIDSEIVIWNREAGAIWKAALQGDTSVNAERDEMDITLKKLLVNSVLIDKEGKKWTWHVKNPNDAAVTFTWKLEGSDEGGTKTIEAGEELVLTASEGDSPKLQLAVTGEQGYEVAIAAAESSDDQSDSVGTSTPPSGPAAPTTDNSAGTSLGSERSVTPVAIDTANGTGSGWVGGSAAGIQTAVNPVAVADANRIGSLESANAMNQPSGVMMNRLPQTGENQPYGLYSIGALLTLIGAFVLRKRKVRSYK